MDSESRNNSLKKIDYLGVYVGFPPRISNCSSLDFYYMNVTNVSSANGFINNYASILNFNAYVTQATFDGTIYDMITPWPSFFYHLLNLVRG